MESSQIFFEKFMKKAVNSKFFIVNFRKIFVNLQKILVNPQKKNENFQFSQIYQKLVNLRVF